MAHHYVLHLPHLVQLILFVFKPCDKTRVVQQSASLRQRAARLGLNLPNRRLVLQSHFRSSKVAAAFIIKMCPDETLCLNVISKWHTLTARTFLSNLPCATAAAAAAVEISHDCDLCNSRRPRPRLITSDAGGEINGQRLAASRSLTPGGSSGGRVTQESPPARSRSSGSLSLVGRRCPINSFPSQVHSDKDSQLFGVRVSVAMTTTNKRNPQKTRI